MIHIYIYEYIYTLITGGISMPYIARSYNHIPSIVVDKDVTITGMHNVEIPHQTHNLSNTLEHEHPIILGIEVAIPGELVFLGATMQRTVTVTATTFCSSAGSRVQDGRRVQILRFLLGLGLWLWRSKGSGVWDVISAA